MAMLRFDEQADNTRIDAHVGDAFEICLQENPTAGYRWTLEQTGAPICDLTGDTYVPGRGVPGRPGSHRWTFRLDAAGTAAIRMTYGRRWEPEATARAFRLTVRATIGK